MTEDGRGSESSGASLYESITLEESVRERYAAPDATVPDAVVGVRDAKALIDTVRWARQKRKPLVAASSSAPHHRACLTMPKAAWVLDFSGMDRVLTVNRRNRVALFEPGVTFEQLAPLAKQNGLRVMTPLMPRRGKSVLAAYLDREPTIYPRHQWDLADPLLCLEVVFGTGDLFRTGSAGGPGTLEQQWQAGELQKGPMGPGQNDWMRLMQGAQGTMGLATWCSAKCEVLPLRQRLKVASSDRLEPLVEASYRLFYRKLTDIHFLLDRNGLTDLLGRTAKGRETAQLQAGAWNLVYSVSGIEHFADERIDYLVREAEKEVRAQGATIAGDPLRAEEQLLDSLLKPGTASDWRNRGLGDHRSVYFQTTMDRAGHFVSKFHELVQETGSDSQRVTRYLQPQLGGRCCHLEFVLAVDPNDGADLEAVERLCSSAAAPLIEAGAFFSRPHGAWAEPAMSQAGSSRWIFEAMKEIFDPDHILAPGRLTLGGDAHA